MKAIKEADESEVLIVVDSYLKKTSYRALLEILYKQCKNIKYLQATYEKNNFLQINYWPGSIILFSIGNEKIEISHTPKFQFEVDWSNDLSVLLYQIVTQYKIYRLSTLSGLGSIKNNRLEIEINENSCVSIDICYFSGDFIVYIFGKIEKYISEMMKTNGFDEVWEKIQSTVNILQFESACRCLSKTLNQHPLRFSRAFHSLGTFTHGQDTIGYIDLGNVLPIDSMGHVTIFALRISGCSHIVSYLVGYNETEEVYSFLIEFFDNFSNTVSFQRLSYY